MSTLDRSISDEEIKSIFEKEFKEEDIIVSEDLISRTLKAIKKETEETEGSGTEELKTEELKTEEQRTEESKTEEQRTERSKKVKAVTAPEPEKESVDKKESTYNKEKESGEEIKEETKVENLRRKRKLYIKWAAGIAAALVIGVFCIQFFSANITKDASNSDMPMESQCNTAAEAYRNDFGKAGRENKEESLPNSYLTDGNLKMFKEDFNNTNEADKYFAVGEIKGEESIEDEAFDEATSHVTSALDIDPIPDAENLTADGIGVEEKLDTLIAAYKNSVSNEDVKESENAAESKTESDDEYIRSLQEYKELQNLGENGVAELKAILEETEDDALKEHIINLLLKDMEKQ